MHQALGGGMKYSLILGYMIVTAQIAVAEHIYVCVPVKSVGFTFDKGTHEWSYDQFDVTRKKYLLMHGKAGWQWYEFGNPVPVPEYCVPNDSGFIDCDGFEDIRVNTK